MTRDSGAAEPNPDVHDVTDQFGAGTLVGAGNEAFFAWALERLQGEGKVVVGLVGQRDIPGVALRQAQSVLRWDHRPSLWSHAFLVTGPTAAGDAGRTPVAEVALYPRSGGFPEPAFNGVSHGTLGDFARPEDANVALLGVGMGSAHDADRVRGRAWSVNEDRLRFPLWETLGVWSGYVWRRDTEPNPLREGFPVPSSAFVEYCFEAAALDLVPGASERNSAPEHVWGAAKWWSVPLREFGYTLEAYAVLRDPGCSLMDAAAPEPPPRH
jgi:hypothetical protein